MSAAIRNICIIAHVDHGKTTLVDHLLRQAGTFQSHEQVTERVMDSDDQERERGITISAKNAAFQLGDVKVNVVDTPGHADFSGEVERIMDLVDGAVLLVDAAEGPLPQTRFVLEQAITKKLHIAVCINKVDRPEVVGSDLVDQCVNKIFDLFVELGATDEQCDFPMVFACARDGWCTDKQDNIERHLDGSDPGTLTPLFEMILNFPAPKVDNEAGARVLVANIAYSDYLGSLALGRVHSGHLQKNQTLFRHSVNDQGDPGTKKFTVSRLLSYEGLQQVEVDELVAGDIGLVAGCPELEIGDTLAEEGCEALPRIAVEEPTMRMIFSVNTSPFSGREGKAIQSRELRERLLQEVRANVALRLEDTEQPDQFYLLGRGELQFSIVIEKMRREGLEFMVGRPMVVNKRTADGKLLEPMERVTLNIPEAHSGDVTRMFQNRRGVLAAYEAIGGSLSEPRVKLVFDIPTRGLLGTNSAFKTATRGAGLMSSEATGFEPHVGTLYHRSVGSLVSDREGKTTAYALAMAQERGSLFIGEGVTVYEGMLVGECARENDLNVNVCRPKKLTNVRSSGSDGLTMLHGLKQMSLEACIEWIEDDEWIESTPKSVRLRKKALAANQRSVRREERMKDS